MTNGALSADKRFDLYQDFIKTILNLSTGALVFSVSFFLALETRPDGAALRSNGLLYGAWASWLVSLLAGLAYLFTLMLAARVEDRYSGWLLAEAIFAIGGFLLGLALFVIFGFFNL